MTRVAAMAACLLVAFPLSGCGGDKKPDPVATVTKTVEPSDSGSASANAKPTTAALDYKKVYEATGPAAFVTPSGNIACEFADNSVRCDIREKSFTPPPRPAGCDLEFGASLVLSSKSEFGCIGETIFGDAAVGSEAAEWFNGQAIMIPGASDGFAHLAYGEALKVGHLRCGSAENGVTCENLTNGRGFRLARASYQLFDKVSDITAAPASTTAKPAATDCRTALRKGGVDGLAQNLVAAINAKATAQVEPCASDGAMESVRAAMKYVTPITDLKPCSLEETGTGPFITCYGKGARGLVEVRLDFNSGSAGESLELVFWIEPES